MKRGSGEKPLGERGNFVSEWFGHRVYPSVIGSHVSLADQLAGRCPFLSEAIREAKKCVKAVSSSGICTVSSPSNGRRQDWLVCPYRALNRTFIEHAARRLFDISKSRVLLLLPAPTLVQPEVRRQLGDSLSAGAAIVVYLQDKVGGEISIPATERSPELAFDITLVEIAVKLERPRVGRYGILEVQTMDFHGSYRHAVTNLKDALRLHGSRFPHVLQDNPAWLCDRVEGPNIANVFKRTFYQMMLKFTIGARQPCTGCILAIPQSVWDSWQRHLGKPDLRPMRDGSFMLAAPPRRRLVGHSSAWIYVFDLEAESETTPNPIKIRRVIRTDAESISYYALTVAPQAAVSAQGFADTILPAIRKRLATWWPEIAGSSE
jgi:hypothetical protein